MLGHCGLDMMICCFYCICYAYMVYAVVMYLVVCLYICHWSDFYQNG